MKNLIKRIKNVFSNVAITIAVFISTTSVTFAAGIDNIGQNVGNWFIEQAGWIGLAVVVFVLIGFLLKRAWIPAIIFAVLASILLFVISKPEVLRGLGESFFQIFVN